MGQEGDPLPADAAAEQLLHDAETNQWMAEGSKDKDGLKKKDPNGNLVSNQEEGIIHDPEMNRWMTEQSKDPAANKNIDNEPTDGVPTPPGLPPPTLRRQPARVPPSVPGAHAFNNTTGAGPTAPESVSSESVGNDVEANAHAADMPVANLVTEEQQELSRALLVQPSANQRKVIP